MEVGRRRPTDGLERTAARPWSWRDPKGGAKRQGAITGQLPTLRETLRSSATGGKATFASYSQGMNEDPRHLRNESRSAHRLHRRNMRMLRWFMILWLIGFAALTGAAAIDVIAHVGWGYEAKDIWDGLLMIVFGCAFWVFATIINHVVLGISRRLYGPEPAGPTEG